MRWALVGLVIVGVGCSDANGPTGPFGLGFSHSSEVVGDTLVWTQVVRVQTQRAEPVSGVTLRFQADVGTVSPARATSGPDGTVSVVWRMAVGSHGQLEVCGAGQGCVSAAAL